MSQQFTRPPGPTPDSAAWHAELVAQLRQPGACAGHGAGGEPAPGLIQTHISSLLLAGNQVYKLKKPLDLGFLDFSTLAARREACEQELRLNRRTAPRLYLDVVPVRQGPAGAFIATAPAWPGAPQPLPSGPVIDWAVHMRRFDDSQRLDRLAQAGKLAPQQVDDLAEAVAQFHAHQSPAPPGHGRAEALRHWARQNLQELAALPLAAPMAGSLATLQRWTEAQGALLAPLMDLRSRTGHVRELHGDLHLANIVWQDGAPLLFDALEFNDTMRHIDTVGDLAFVFMDLLAQGQPRLAWRFINASWQASGDWAALPLLRWWASYRALVRAKVALLAAPAGADAQAQAAAVAQAQRYLAVAWSLAAPTTAAPRLLLMCGLSGSGKSRVALVLAEQLGALRLRSDVERKRLFGLAPGARGGPEVYSDEATRRTHERLHELATLALQSGWPVIVDAASLRRSERAAMQALAEHSGARYTLLLCEAPADVLLQRVRQRLADGSDASDATPEVLARQQGWFEPPGDDEAAQLLRLRTELPVEVLAQRALAWLAGDGPAEG